MLDLSTDRQAMEKNAAYCRQRGIRLPTFANMANPESAPPAQRQALAHTGLWDMHPANLFRITWKNQPVAKGGGFGGINHLVLPPELTGCEADIIVLSGKWFPTGAHKVGAAYACLAPRLVTGQFCPQGTQAVWPSTGNYCRGGAYISALLATGAVAILPEGMSRERFRWLAGVAAEVIATPGSESNVKEIFDKCAELAASGRNLRIFNQFDELGNPLWHYRVTGNAVAELMERGPGAGKTLAGFVAGSGSSGTLGAGYFLQGRFPGCRLAVAEALQCPTLLMNGFGEHRIEGIGDKHVPWVHDCKRTDVVIAVDDNQPMRLLRLFNHPEGRKALAGAGAPPAVVENLGLLGISGIANLVAAIKLAKYLELGPRECLVTVATDSMELYGSRLEELEAVLGPYDAMGAARDLELLAGITTDHLKELDYPGRKAIHNLKYFTWVEQQGKTTAELNAQWSDHEAYWQGAFDQADQIDHLIGEFNRLAGF